MARAVEYPRPHRLRLLLLIVTRFFSISAPNEPWVWLATTVTLAASLMVAMVASGAHPKVVRAGLAIAATDLGASITIALTQVGRFQEIPLGNEPAPDAAREGRNWPPDQDSRRDQCAHGLGAVCFYVLLGLIFAFAFECVREFGSRPFFTSQGAGNRSDYVYFSFTTMATVGFGNLTAQGGIGRALEVTEGIFGQIYLVTAVAALVGNLGCRRTPLQEMNEEVSAEEGEWRSG